MAHSYVSFGPNSVLMHDAEITATVYYILRFAEAHPDRYPEAEHPYLAVWRGMDDNCASGALDLELDENLHGPADLARFHRLAADARAALAAEPEVIPGSRLDALVDPEFSSGYGDRPREKMLADFDRLVAVVPQA